MAFSMNKVFGFAVLGIILLVLSFVVRNFVLNQEFDIVSELLNIVTVLVLVSIGAWIMNKVSVLPKSPVTAKVK